MLPPHELQLRVLGQVFLDGVVNPLDQHAVKVGPLQQVCHGGRVAKRVDGPTTLWYVACESRKIKKENQNLI